MLIYTIWGCNSSDLNGVTPVYNTWESTPLSRGGHVCNSPGDTIILSPRDAEWQDSQLITSHHVYDSTWEVSLIMAVENRAQTGD